MNEQEFGTAAREAGRRLKENMPSSVQAAVFLLLAAGGIVLGVYTGSVTAPEVGFVVGLVGVVLAALIASAIQVANQWERAIVLRLGEYRGVRGPGLFLIVPVIDRVRVVDMRVLALDIPRQEAITKDNVPVAINGALFFKVVSVDQAVMRVQDFVYGISLLAQTALRDVVGGMVLDELLAERERIGKIVEQAVAKDSADWGLEVTGIRLMDINMPEDLKRIMSRQAGAEREKRATITKAEGDRMAAENLAAAAATMFGSPGAMQLRTLQTLDGLGPTSSNTVVLAVPIEILDMFKRVGKEG